MLLGMEADLDITSFPDFLHTTYEITWVGMTEKEAREKLEKVFVIMMPIKDYPGHCPIPLAERTMLRLFQSSGYTPYRQIPYLL